MKVWVLTSGEYSDYRIEGIFSDKDEAYRIYNESKEIAYCDYNEPDEWEMDELAGQQFGKTYEAVVVMETGEIQSSVKGKLGLRAPESCEIGYVGEFNNYEYVSKYRNYITNTVHRLSVKSPISAEHAAKVAAEKRQEWLRTEEIRKAEEDRKHRESLGIVWPPSSKPVST